MDKNRTGKTETVPQTNGNPSGERVSNPFENNRSVDQDTESAKEELAKEQAFKEAQTERD